MASDIKVNNIKSYTGNTLNLGDTGDTINLTGASFNGTSSVIWDTTPKTSAFNAVAGSGYFVDTTSAAITATLPATPSAGDIIAFKDYAGTFGTNNLILDRNGSNIQGEASNAALRTNKASVVLVYVDGTQGWLATNESNVGTLILTVPDAPTIGTATATGSTTATVTFTAPANDGGSTITSYTATSSPDGITGTLNQAGSGTITITGLTTDTAYTFTVTATNAIGTSDPSAASNSVTPEVLFTATGGTITTDGDFKVHTFTSSGTFTVTKTSPTSNSVDYLVVGGGGGGGSDRGGGGGAGGHRYSFPNPATGGQPVTTNSYPITIGAGGAATPLPPASHGNGSQGNPGNSSSAFPITSAGGGGGGACVSGGRDGLSGGSGGGGSQFGGNGAGGSGNTPSVSPPQGNNGGTGFEYGGGGGGGGASQTGTNATNRSGQPGGDGTTLTIPGSSTTTAGGGGGGGVDNFGNGGSGGGGSGGRNDGTNPSVDGTAGTANTGGGGGGGGQADGPTSVGQGGGSGVVVIRYKFQ